MTHLQKLSQAPPSAIPRVPSPENIPKINTLDTLSYISNLNTSAGYTLPFKENRGKPPKRYSPAVEERRSKYPIANYVSTRRLSKPLRAFVHLLSSSGSLV
jgi:hypothetical protein